MCKWIGLELKKWNKIQLEYRFEKRKIFRETKIEKCLKIDFDLDLLKSNFWQKVEKYEWNKWNRIQIRKEYLIFVSTRFWTYETRNRNFQNWPKQKEIHYYCVISIQYVIQCKFIIFLNFSKVWNFEGCPKRRFVWQ